MGAYYAIATIEPANFKLDMESFKAALQQRWADVVISPSHDDDIDFGMTINGTFDNLIGSTIKARQIHWWRRTELKEFAEFAKWYRSLMPDDHKLIAWYGGFLAHFVLVAGVTEAEIIQGFSEQEFSCEIILPKVEANIELAFIEKMQIAWSGAVISRNKDGSISWLMKSQNGRFDIKSKTIYLYDNDLSNIARVAKWCRNMINCDQKLIARDIPARKSTSSAQIEITLQTTEQQIIDHLEGIFMRE